MPKLKWVVLVLIVSSLFLANCFGSDEETPTPEPTATPQPAATATPQPAATVAEPTATVAEPTATVAAQSAPSDTKSISQTQEAYPAPAADANAQAASAEAYPPPSAAQAAPAAPVSGQAYPAPSGKRGPDFTIDPVTKAGDEIVRGTGPAGVSIRIVNVSMVGDVMGKGAIGEDGKFEIEVTPVVAGDRIGIMLEDVSNSQYEISDFVNNEHYQDLPMVGLLVYYLDIPLK